MYTPEKFRQKLEHEAKFCSFYDTGGAMKVLIAGKSPDVKTLWPGFSAEQDYQLQDYVVACAPPNNSDSSPADEDVWQYSRQVLQLLRESP
jgi:hypothetical protein